MNKGILCLAALSLAVPARAAEGDRKGCRDSKVLTRMTGCVITECNYKDYNEALMPLEKGDKSNMVEGEYERVGYGCASGTSPLQSIRNVENALKAAGFTIRYSDKYFTTRYWLTANKGPQWVYANSEYHNYYLTTVKTTAMEQSIEANADGWGRQIVQTGRASIHGIHFDTAKATIKPESEPVLKEVVKMLQANPDWAFVIAGHTDNVGGKEANLTLSRQRADSVVAWLAGQGIDKGRLVPAGFGDTRPLADNANEDGRTTNRRVDLVRLY